MKYTIESTEKGCIETIELDDGRQYTREHTRTSFGSKCDAANPAMEKQKYKTLTSITLLQSFSFS